MTSSGPAATPSDFAGGRRLLSRKSQDRRPAEPAEVAGEKSDCKDQEYIFKGIAGRAFERKFSLADYVEVERASCDNGLLQIDLVRRVPDAMKPRAITIETGLQASNVASLKAA